MGIRKRGDKWLVTAESGRDEFGMRRRVCRTVDSEEEAKRLDAKLQNDVYEGRHVKPSGESVPDFCQRYLDGRDKLAPATRSRYEAYLKHVRRDLASVTLARFTPRVAASWKKKQLESGELSSSTVRKHLIFVSAAMNLAVAWRLISRTPSPTSSCPMRSRRPSTSTRRVSRRRCSRRLRRETATRRATTRAAVKGRCTSRSRSTSPPDCAAASCSACASPTSTLRAHGSTCARRCGRSTASR